MALNAAKSRKAAKPVKVTSAADRILTPSFKPTNGITRTQIRKVVRELAAKREVQQQG